MGSGSNLSSSSTAVGLAVIQTSRTESKRVSDPLKKPRMQNLLMNTNLKKKKNVPSWMRNNFRVFICSWVQKGSWEPSKRLKEGSKTKNWTNHTRTKKHQNSISHSEELRSTKSFWKWIQRGGGGRERRGRGGERNCERKRGREKVRDGDCWPVGQSVLETLTSEIHKQLHEENGAGFCLLVCSRFVLLTISVICNLIHSGYSSLHLFLFPFLCCQTPSSEQILLIFMTSCLVLCAMKFI